MPSVRSISSLLQRVQTGSRPEQRARAAPSALSAGKRVDPELRVVGLAAPAVLVLRPVVDEQQEAGRGQALDQAVEQRLRLAVDPVQVLEDDEERLHLALAEEEPLDGVEGALPALRRIERLPVRRRRRATSSRASRAGRSGFERLVQGEELARHLLADRPRWSSRRSIWKYALSRSMTGR